MAAAPLRLVVSCAAAVVLAACSQAVTDPVGEPAPPSDPTPAVSVSSSSMPVAMSDPPPGSTPTSAVVSEAVATTEVTTTTEVITTTSTTVVTTPRVLTAAFTGDVLIHSHIWTQAQRNAIDAGDIDGYDFSPMFDEIAPIISGVDFAVCHLEVPLRLPGREPSTHPFYGAPSQIVGDLAAAGYDHCSTASNHTLDQGVEGINITLDEFDRVGITQSGMARTPAEIEPRVLDVSTADGRAVAVAHLSYTWSYNGLQPPQDQQWRSALIDPQRVIDDARTARALGAEVVIVSLHWGAEKVSAVTGQQRGWATDIIAADVVDLIVGHHAHVLQPIEQVNGTWVAFGLGNVLSFHPTTDEWPAASQDAGVLTVSFTVDESSTSVDDIAFHPTWVDKSNGRVIRDVQAGIRDEATSAWLRSQLEASLRRTVSVVGEFVSEHAG